MSTAINALSNADLAALNYGIGKIYNVMHFGAAGDGVTDDSAAIQSAINTAYLAGDSSVYMPSNIYSLASVLTPKDGINFTGVRPKLVFVENCPDLSFTQNGGTVLKAATTGLTAFAANTTDNPVSEEEPLSNVKFKNFGLKGFNKCFDIGAIEQKGMGFGGFESIYVDGTGDDNVTVQTSLAFDIKNSQQMVSTDIMIYKVTNGIKVTNNHSTCSSGNSVWNKVYCYMDAAITSQGSATITGITVGATTSIEVVGHGLQAGDIFQASGVTGTHAALMNRVHKVDSVTDADNIIIDLNLSGKTVTAAGTIEKGRAGIHLVAIGQPLNHVTFTEPQINFFLASEQSKAFCNMALCGTSSAAIGACSLLQTDMEGPTDHNIYIDGAAALTLQIATSYVTEPTLGHIAAYNTSSANIVSSSGDTTLKLGDTALQGGGSTDGNLGIMLYGVIKSFKSSSRMPQNGQWYEITAGAGYTSCGTLHRGIEFDQTTFSWGPPKGQSTWAQLRLASRPTNTTTGLTSGNVTGSHTMAASRMGIYRCINTVNATLDLPAIGSASNQADEGAIAVVSKVSGAGTVSIATSGGDTIGMQASPNTSISNTAGNKLFLMSDGVSDWIIL